MRDFKNHQRGEQHGGVGHHQCPKLGCNATVSRKNNLKQHAVHNHLERISFVCDQLNCGKVIETESNMRAHMKSHEKLTPAERKAVMATHHTRAAPIIDRNYKAFLEECARENATVHGGTGAAVPGAR